MFNWTGEAVELLTKLRADSHSFTECTDIINQKFGGGLTRNAAIGKAGRLGIPGPISKDPHGSRLTKASIPRIKKARVPFRFPFVARQVIPVPPVIPSSSHRVHVIQAENNHCRWPLWADDAPFDEKFYCGSPTANVTGGRPYCRHHTEMALGQSKAAEFAPEEIERRRQMGLRNFRTMRVA